MASAPPDGLPMFPGVVTDEGKYPQWGVKTITAGSKYDIKEAHNAADKQKLLDQAYAPWFTSSSAAKDYVQGQEQFQLPDPLAGIAGALSAFYHTVTDGKMWRSVGWLLLGILLMLAGVAWWIGPSASRMSPLGAAAQAGRRLAT